MATAHLSFLGGWFDPTCDHGKRRYYKPCVDTNFEFKMELMPQPPADATKLCNFTGAPLDFFGDKHTASEWVAFAEKYLKSATLSYTQGLRCNNNEQCANEHFAGASKDACTAEYVFDAVNDEIDHLFGEKGKKCDCVHAPWMRSDVEFRHLIQNNGTAIVLYEEGQDVPKNNIAEILPPQDRDLNDYVSNIRLIETYASCNPQPEAIEPKYKRPRYRHKNRDNRDHRHYADQDQDDCEDCESVLPPACPCRPDHDFQLILLTLYSDPLARGARIQDEHQLIWALCDTEFCLAHASDTIPNGVCAGSGPSLISFEDGTITNYAKLINPFRDVSSVVISQSNNNNWNFLAATKYLGAEIGTTIVNVKTSDDFAGPAPSNTNSSISKSNLLQSQAVHVSLSEHVNMNMNSDRISLARGSGIPRLILRHSQSQGQDQGQPLLPATDRCYDVDLIDNDFAGARRGDMVTGVFLTGIQQPCDGFKWVEEGWPIFKSLGFNVCAGHPLVPGQVCDDVSVCPNSGGTCYEDTGAYNGLFDQHYYGLCPNNKPCEPDNQWWETSTDSDAIYTQPAK